MKTQKLLDVPAAAAMLGLKETTIRRKIFERSIAFVKIGKAVRIPIEALNEIIADGWREPVAR